MEEEQLAFSSQPIVAETWHKRLGHFHHKVILYIWKKDLAKGLPPLEEELPSCEACQFGKQIRLSFTKSTWKVTQKL